MRVRGMLAALLCSALASGAVSQVAGDTFVGGDAAPIGTGSCSTHSLAWQFVGTSGFSHPPSTQLTVAATGSGCAIAVVKGFTGGTSAPTTLGTIGTQLTTFTLPATAGLYTVTAIQGANHSGFYVEVTGGGGGPDPCASDYDPGDLGPSSDPLSAPFLVVPTTETGGLPPDVTLVGLEVSLTSNPSAYTHSQTFGTTQGVTNRPDWDAQLTCPQVPFAGELTIELTYVCGDPATVYTPVSETYDAQVPGGWPPGTTLTGSDVIIDVDCDENGNVLAASFVVPWWRAAPVSEGYEPTSPVRWEMTGPGPLLPRAIASRPLNPNGGDPAGTAVAIDVTGITTSATYGIREVWLGSIATGGNLQYRSLLGFSFDCDTINGEPVGDPGGGDPGGGDPPSGGDGTGAWDQPEIDRLLSDIAAMRSSGDTRNSLLSSIDARIASLLAQNPGLTAAELQAILDATTYINVGDGQPSADAAGLETGLNSRLGVPTIDLSGSAASTVSVPFPLPGGDTHDLVIELDPEAWPDEPVYNTMDTFRGSIRALIAVLILVHFAGKVWQALRQY